MSPGSAAPTRTWQRITAPPCCRRGCGGHATRPRSRWPCRSCSAGSWPGCAIAGFFSLAELNGAIRELVVELNARPMRHLGTSRRALFERLERSALLALPAEPYAYAEWRRCRAGLDYHVEVQGHFYSVPYRLAREVIEVRITEQAIEVFHRGGRVASHLRSSRRPGQTTIARAHAKRTPAPRRADAHPVAAARRRRSVPPPPGWWRPCSPPSRIPSRVSAPASASCAWCAATAPDASRRPASVGSTSAPPLAARCNRSCAAASTVSPRPEPAPDEPPVWHGNIRGGGYYH